MKTMTIAAALLTCLYLPTGSVFGETTWKSLESLIETEPLHPFGMVLPYGADPSWIERMQHRHHHRMPMQGKSPEPTNFGGYINLLKQDVRMKFDPQTGWIEEELDVVVEINKDGMDKVPLYFTDSLELKDITGEDGEPLEWDRSGGTLLLFFDPPLEEGTLLSFTLEAEGGFSCPNTGIKPCAFGKKFSYLTHADYYVQGNALSVDLFQGSLEVEVPVDKTVIATGRLVESYPGESGQVYRYWHDYETIFYSFAVAEYQTSEQWVEGIPVRVHTLPKEVDDHVQMLDLAEEILTFFNQTFRPYPFNNLDMVQMDGSFGGGYGPQATVFMYEDVFSFGDGGGWGGGAARTQLVSHEIAHQWWGNFVNLSSSNAVILSEGLAEFSSALHWEKMHYSRSNFVSNGMNYVYTVPKEGDIALSASAASGAYYNTLAYDKASVVFDMLKHELGEELFYTGLRHYMDRHGYGAASLSDFVEAMEEGTGEDLSVFADQWFYNAGYPRLVATAETNRMPDGLWQTEIRIEQTGDKSFSMQLPISATQADENRVISLGNISVTEEETIFVYQGPNPPERFTLDNKRVYLHRIQSGNPGDPNLSGIEDGSDLIDMSAMLHRNIVFSYGNENYFYPNSAYSGRYDLNQDGIIGFEDLDLLTGETAAEGEEEGN